MIGFGFRFAPKLVPGSVQQATQTSLNNPDFNNGPDPDEFGLIRYADTIDVPEYGWVKKVHSGDGDVVISGDIYQCDGEVEVNGYSVVGLTWQYANTAVLKGGEVYDVVFRCADGSTPILIDFDAYISGVAQGVGGSVLVNHLLGDCQDSSYVSRAGVLDASMIGDFEFRFGCVMPASADIRIRRIEWLKQ